MGKEINQGYEIIASEAYCTTNLGRIFRIVLGRMMTSYGAMFVTWDSTIWPLSNGSVRIDYDWGHYFDDGKQAFIDYHRRLLEKYEQR